MRNISARILVSRSVPVGGSFSRIFSNISAAEPLSVVDSEGLVICVMSVLSDFVLVCLRWYLRLYQYLCKSLCPCRSLSGCGQVGLVTAQPLICRHLHGMRLGLVALASRNRPCSRRALVIHAMGFPCHCTPLRPRSIARAALACLNQDTPIRRPLTAGDSDD